MVDITDRAISEIITPHIYCLPTELPDIDVIIGRLPIRELILDKHAKHDVVT